MNKVLIEIFKENESLDINEGISKKGNPYKIISQYGYATLADKFPIKIKIKMEDGQPFYKEGVYELMIKSALSVSPHGDLEFGRTMILIPYVKGKDF